MNAPSNPSDWSAQRALFPIFSEARYLAACSHSPLGTPVAETMRKFLDSWRDEGNPWETEWMPMAAHTAERFATLIGAPSGSIALTSSVSSGVSAVLSALDFSTRPKVVTSALDFPTLPDILLAYAQQGAIELTILPQEHGSISLDAYARAVDARTALVCISTASYATGSRLPVADVIELAHARGALCLVDAYQTLGAVALDVAQLQPDVLVCGTLKYLLGMSGLGFLYVAPHLADNLQPRGIGWMAAANPFGTHFERFDYAAGAARFQGGTFNIAGCYAACAALDLLLGLGREKIEERVLALVARFAEGVRDLGVDPLGPTEPGLLGPMVAVPVTGDAHALQEQLRHQERIITSARGQALRFAFHCYNDESDVTACLDVVRRYLSHSDGEHFVRRSPG